MAVAAQFTQYPAWVAWYAADPIKGIPRHLKFRVTVADVAEFCSRLFTEHLREKARAKQINSQLDERKRLPSPDEFPERREAVVGRIQSMHGPRWGITQQRAVAECHESPEEACMRVLGIDAEAFAKIPDRNGRISGVQLGDEALARAKGEAA